jgi:DNA-binding NtrC family response regulator
MAFCRVVPLAPEGADAGRWGGPCHGSPARLVVEAKRGNSVNTGDTLSEVESRASERAGVAGLLWLHPEERFSPFSTDTLLFGRGAEASVVLPSEHVSRTHARLRRVGQLRVLSDAGSRNGTYVNGQAIQETPLKLDDVVRLGDWIGLVLELDEGQAGEARHFQERDGGVLVGPRSASLWRQLDTLAPSAAPILIEGPTGTGKEVIARALHDRSGRAGPFVGINCAALPEALVEAQLFGHARGAYTGATQSAEGLIGSADHGTLLLDELVDLPLAQQAKLLRVIEEGAVLRVGESVPRPIDVRFLAACQTPLWSLVERGQFRADLLGRLSGAALRLAPLCERREEIPRLFSAAFAKAGGDPNRLKSSAIEALCLATWPLNIRQLVQLARSAQAALGGDNEIGRNALAPLLADTVPPLAADAPSLAAEPAGSGTAPETLVLGERRAQWLARHQQDLARLLEALPKSRGNVSAAARVVGLSRSAAMRLLEAHAQVSHAARRGT